MDTAQQLLGAVNVMAAKMAQLCSLVPAEKRSDGKLGQTVEAVMKNMAAVKQALTNASETGKTMTAKAAATSKPKDQGGQRNLTPKSRL